MRICARKFATLNYGVANCTLKTEGLINGKVFAVQAMKEA